MLVRMTKSNMPQAFEIVGDPGWIRTSDLQLRRLLLFFRSNAAGRTTPPLQYSLIGLQRFQTLQQA